MSFGGEGFDWAVGGEFKGELFEGALGVLVVVSSFNCDGSRRMEWYTCESMVGVGCWTYSDMIDSMFAFVPLDVIVE